MDKFASKIMSGINDARTYANSRLQACPKVKNYGIGIWPVCYRDKKGGDWCPGIKISRVIYGLGKTYDIIYGIDSDEWVMRNSSSRYNKVIMHSKALEELMDKATDALPSRIDKQKAALDARKKLLSEVKTFVLEHGKPPTMKHPGKAPHWWEIGPVAITFSEEEGTFQIHHIGRGGWGKNSPPLAPKGFLNKVSAYCKKWEVLDQLAAHLSNPNKEK